MSHTPKFSHEEIIKKFASWNVQVQIIGDLPSYDDQNILAVYNNKKVVIKIHRSGPPDVTQRLLELENWLMISLQKQEHIKAPTPINMQEGSLIVFNEKPHHFARVITWIEGDVLAKQSTNPYNFGKMIGELNRILRTLNPPAKFQNMNIETVWNLKNANKIITERIKLITNLELKNSIQRFLHLWNLFNSVLENLPQTLIHGDLNDNNILFDIQTGKFGVLDFNDASICYRVADLAIALTYYLFQFEEISLPLREAISGYFSVVDISPQELSLLLPMIGIRLCTSIVLSTEAITNNPENEYITISQTPAIELLNKLDQLSIDELLDPMQTKIPRFGKISLNIDYQLNSTSELHNFRKSKFSSALSLSYEKPLTIISGRENYLYDEYGTAYLDLVNNVPIIGHSNPAVITAIFQQSFKINTNFRYLHPLQKEYTHKLLKYFPPNFDKVFYVNSGSEANELALRISRKYLKTYTTVVLEDAYHGNTDRLIEISPYKFLGKGGAGQAAHVKVIPRADVLRGMYQDDKALQRCIDDAITEIGQEPVIFIAEAVMGVAGQYFPPAEYLKKISAHVKSQGGLCIFDEVQIGFGRLGSHFWAFEYQGLQDFADIIVMGKPMGNGHPIGAVVTKSEITDSFEDGMEYFSTFGGNPVSLAAANAVLEEIESKELMSYALEIGNYFILKLKEVISKFDIIGEIRGHGLFIGIEIRQSDNPATDLTMQIIELMKSKFILLSYDGPKKNILKIKPPLTLRKEDVNNFITNLASVISNLTASNVKKK